MPDRETVITHLQIISTWASFARERDLQFFTPKHLERITKWVDDALELLKEQEAKPMTEYDDGWDCPRCGLKLVGKTASGYPCDEFDLPNDEIVKYCPVCGQAVKWDE